MKALSEPFPKFILSVRLLLISPCSKKKKKKAGIPFLAH